MDATQQRILARRNEAEKKLQYATRELADVQSKVDKINLELGILNDLLGDEILASALADVSDRAANHKNGNGLVRQNTIVAVVGDTAQAMARELEMLGGKSTLAKLAERMVSPDASEAERTRVLNNVSSVFYRAIKNPEHPLFRKAGRGEIQLATMGG